MKARRLVLLPATALLALTAYAAWSQDKNAPKPSAQKSAPRTWNIEAAAARFNDATGIGEARQVVVNDPEEGTVLHADLWQWNTKTKTAKATGGLLLSDPQAEVTGERADIDYARAKRIAVLTGKVRITIKSKRSVEEAPPTAPPAPAPVTLQNGQATAQTPPAEEGEDSLREARRHPTVVTCDKVEYHYARNKRYALLTGNFKAVQQLPDKTRTLTAKQAEWFGLEDRLVLRGPVHVEDTKGMKGDTPDDVVVYTKEGEERMEMKGKFSGVYPVEEEEDEVAPSPPPTGNRPR